jgi:hypothetical protein
MGNSICSCGNIDEEKFNYSYTAIRSNSSECNSVNKSPKIIKKIVLRDLRNKNIARLKKLKSFSCVEENQPSNSTSETNIHTKSQQHQFSFAQGVENKSINDRFLICNNNNEIAFRISMIKKIQNGIRRYLIKKKHLKMNPIFRFMSNEIDSNYNNSNRSESIKETVCSIDDFFSSIKHNRSISNSITASVGKRKLLMTKTLTSVVTNKTMSGLNGNLFGSPFIKRKNISNLSVNLLLDLQAETSSILSDMENTENNMEKHQMEPMKSFINLANSNNICSLIYSASRDYDKLDLIKSYLTKNGFHVEKESVFGIKENHINEIKAIGLFINKKLNGIASYMIKDKLYQGECW